MTVFQAFPAPKFPLFHHTFFFSLPTKWALRKMTGQKIDEGAKQRELEVADQCEYKRYLLLPPTCSLSHDGERQA